jgi:hypothetical protein
MSLEGMAGFFYLDFPEAFGDIKVFFGDGVFVGTSAKNQGPRKANQDGMQQPVSGSHLDPPE